MKIKFPHFKRKFNASLFVSLILLLIAASNILENQLFKWDEEKKLRFKIMENPNISSLHEKLGQYYLHLDEQKAKREYDLAEEFYQQTPSYGLAVLGAQSSPWQTWLNFLSKKQNFTTEISYWKEVEILYPDYLYAKLKLALLYYQQGNKERAKEYLQQILQEDTFNQTALKLKEKLFLF